MWFPRLASERWLRIRPIEGPFALTHRSGNADHLHCLNGVASAKGLRRGMPLADARALCPDLVTRASDLPREGAFLGSLARWMGRYAPWVARDGLDGVMVDLTGSAHLYGGEAALVGDLQARLARAGISAATGIADTVGAAHALARHGGGIAAADTTLDAIGPLPVAALRIDSDTAATLARLGLRTIRDLVLVPRAPLARRFGPALMLRLDQALGQVSEPVSAETGPPHFAVRLTLPEPIGLVTDVEAGLQRLLDRLCETLDLHGMGARRLRLELRRVDGGEVALEIGLARAMRDPLRILPLFRAAIAEVEAGFGIDRMRLVGALTEPMPAVQLSAAQEKGQDKLADLVTRLGNRLGFENVLRLLPADSHVPERSYLIAPMTFSAAEPEGWPITDRRPLTLFPPERIDAMGAEPPARFRWRRMAMVTGRATGPERLTPEWWFDDPAWRSGLRDYWRVETREGRRLWLYHTPQSPAWYVQGEFA